MDLASYLNLANGQLLTALLIFSRLTALLVATPLLNGKNVPLQVKTGLAAIMALVLAPLTPHQVPDNLLLLALCLGKEVLLGLLMGWATSLIFAGVQMAGEWMDLQGGFQQGMLLNPLFDAQTAPLGSFKSLLAGLIFFGSSAYAIVIRAGAASLQISPPGVLRLNAGQAEDWIPLIVQATWLAVQLAAPVAAALFLAEIAVALANKAMPQVNTMMLTLPLKGALAVGALAVCIPVIARALGLAFEDLGPQLVRLLRLVGA